MSDSEESSSRFGTVALVGRPNAGKSTLLNRLLGEKVSIVSDKPQTTRNRIVGILNEPGGQIVFLDTPGIHKPLHRMNVRMMNHVRSSLIEADIVCVLVDISAPFGHGEQYVLEMIREQAEREGAVCMAILNKIDRVAKPLLLPIIQRYSDTGLFREIVPVSATNGDGVSRVVSALMELLPEGRPRFDEDTYTTQPERFLAAELIREKLLRLTRNELPYTTAVTIERWEEERKLVRIFATIYVERQSQKKIVIGAGGSLIKAIGTAARVELEGILGSKVFLDLHVSVHESWREDERFLGELEWPLDSQ